MRARLVVLLLGVAFLSHPASAAPPQFLAPYTSYRLDPNDVSGVVLADLNGDGYPDIVSALGEIGIQLNLNNGAFGAAAYLSGMGGGVATADLNHDGKADLVAGGFANTLIVRFGNGDGTFAPAVSYSVSNSIEQIAIADVDGDGNADVLTMDGTSAFHVYRSQANGALLAPNSFDTGLSVYYFGTADLDGDGRADIAVADFTGNISVLYNDGSGGFLAPVSLGLVRGGGLTLADIDGDGRSDVIFGTSYLPNTGGHTFGPVVAVGDTTEGGPTVADLNGDGVPDLITLYAESQESVGLRVRIGLGGGQFAPPRFQITSTSPEGPCVVADLDHDGVLDIVVPAYTPGDMNVLMGNGDGTFGHRLIYPTAAGPTALAAGDLDGNGTTDVAVLDHDSNTMQIFPGDGAGRLLTPTNLSTPNDPQSIAIGDIDADGIQDIVVGGGASSVVSVYLGTGGGAFAPRADYATAGGALSIAIGDLNGDGRPDVAVATPPNTLSRFLSNSDGTLGPRADYASAPSTSAGVVALADVNGDGIKDALVLGRASIGTLSVFPGNGDGTFGTRTDIGVFGGTWLGVGDMNGDGKVDVVGVQSSSFRVRLGNGDGTFTALATQFGVQHQGRMALLGDVDADGKLDLVVGHFQGGTLQPCYGMGNGMFNVPDERYGTGGAMSAAILAPMDGNSSPDLVAVSQFTNTLTILLNTAGIPLSTPVADTRIPRVLMLDRVFPNPAGRDIGISFGTAEHGSVRLELLDIGGRRVLQRDLGAFTPGMHDTRIQLVRGLRAGIYWVRIVQGSHTASRRVVVAG